MAAFAEVSRFAILVLTSFASRRPRQRPPWRRYSSLTYSRYAHSSRLARLTADADRRPPNEARRSTSGSVSLGVAIVVEDFFGRARREEGAYREYATNEQRRLGEKRPTAMVMNGETDPLVLSQAIFAGFSPALAG